MANRKPCIKCGRSIDEFARACPYCSWWQSEPLPAKPAPPPAIDYVPPPDHRARNKLIGIIAFAVLLLVVFLIGAFLHGSDEARAGQAKRLSANAPAQPSPRATVTLIPVTEGTAPSSESPITTVAPSAGIGTVAPTDATALPSDQYAAAAARMRAAGQTTDTVVDPRSITGAPYIPAPARPRPQRMAHLPTTQPVPLFQPIPQVHVDREQTAQLYLTVGTDGRVHDVDIRQAAPAVMGPLIGTVQQWRFRPATESGQAVTSRFSVAVTFRP